MRGRVACAHQPDASAREEEAPPSLTLRVGVYDIPNSPMVGGTEPHPLPPRLVPWHRVAFAFHFFVADRRPRGSFTFAVGGFNRRRTHVRRVCETVPDRRPGPVLAGNRPDRGDDPPKPPAAPVQLTAQQDHKRMLDCSTSRNSAAAPTATTARPRTPPTTTSRSQPEHQAARPAGAQDGQKVTTAEVWVKQRRPEIVEDFDREVYGRVPKETPTVKWELKDTKEEKVGDGRSGHQAARGPRRQHRVPGDHRRYST